jgi:quinoprotein glucose dehydrogenase
VFDRLTGKPVWPIEERPVPASTVPGEQASKTQPIPSRPAPFDIQGATDDNLIDLTPEIHQEAIAIADAYDRGGLFIPPSQRGTIQMPGNAGGASWTGAAVDPDTHTLYVPTFRLPVTITIRKPDTSQGSYDFIGLPKYLPGPRGLPLLKPPFGSIVAIDMNSGDQRWRIPVGRSAAMSSVQKINPSGNYGLMARSWAMVTKTVMVVVQMGYFSPPRFQPGVNAPIRDLHNLDPHLWVYDKTTGDKLAEIDLPSNATGAPITYMAGGKQFIVFPVGGGPVTEELIAVAL